MNSALVLGGHYFGATDLGRVCACDQEMSLNHILSGCTRYDLRPLLSLLLDKLREVSLKATLKTLHLDKWAVSLWYPLLVLHALEHDAL